MGSVSLLNKAQEPISRATLTTSWGQTIQAIDVEPSKSVELKYQVREGDYRVEVVFRSGKRLRTEAVYVTTGFDYRDEIIVTPSEIQLSHKPISSR
jgi:hypothetical protein